MKYVSANHLEGFEFHDAILKFVSYKDKTLTATAKYLNLHKDTRQNPYDYDAEIADAVISWECFEVQSLEDYTNTPQINYYGKDAEEVLIRELKESFSLNGLNIRKENEKIMVVFETNGDNSYFNAICSCTNVKVEWDEYCGLAWYEKQKTHRYDVTLATPDGEEKSTIAISQWLDDHEITTQVIAFIRYDEKDYYGNGTDDFWIDAIADLQNQLPDNVILKCCVACKHGSLCPVGNDQNEVFCVNDITPKDKSDLFFYTEDENERRKRSREYFSQCERFEPQEEDGFTYNDFCYYLKYNHNR